MPKRQPSRHEPTLRLTELRTLLRAGPVSFQTIKDRLGISHSTAQRYLRTLSLTDTVADTTLPDGQRAFCLRDTRKMETLQVATTEMVSLVLARKMLSVLSGTGIAEDLEEVASRLLLTLKTSDANLAKNLDRKVYDLGEGRRVYDEKADPMDDLLTGLLREEKVEVTYGRGNNPRTFILRPYTLVSYKRGLYFLGLSEHHEEVRLFALDSVQVATWQRGQGFEYPKSHDPQAFFHGRFGVIGGEETLVRIRFDEGVAPYVERRVWHETQDLSREKDGSLVFTMRVQGTTEVLSWVLSYGQTAEVLEPVALRARVAEELRRAAARYG